MRVKCLQLGVVEIDLGRWVVARVKQLTALHPIQRMNPLEGKLDPGVYQLHLLKAAGKSHVGANRDHTTLLLDLSLQFVIGDLQSRLVRLQLITNAR